MSAPVKRKGKLLSLLLLIILKGINPSYGFDIGETFSRSVGITGELSSYGELYSVAGRESRKPSSAGRVYMRTDFSLLSTFRISFSLMLTNTGSSARQEINRISLNPKWRWGQAHLGYFTPNISNLFLRGTTVKGAGLNLYPGPLRLLVAGGETRRAVESGWDNSVYRRVLYGIKLGLGEASGTHFDINAMYARDDSSSISIEPPSADTTVIDSLLQFPQGEQNGVTPKENLAMGVETQISLFSRSLIIRGEAAASAYTRNQYAAEEKLDKTPRLITDIFKIRRSSSFDYAYTAAMDINLTSFRLSTAHTYVGPGYYSLGLPTNSNDRNAFEVSGRYRFAGGRLSLKGKFRTEHNNLIDQKVFTTAKNSYQIGSVIRIFRGITANLSLTWNIMTNDASDDSSKVDILVGGYSIGLNFAFRALNLNHSASINYTNQSTSDRNIIRRGKDVTIQNISFAGSTILSRSFTLSPSLVIGITDSESAGRTTTANTALNLGSTFFNGKATNNLSCGFVSSRQTGILRINEQISLFLYKAATLRLIITHSSFNGKSKEDKDYHETTAGLNFAHRF